MMTLEFKTNLNSPRDLEKLLERLERIRQIVGLKIDMQSDDHLLSILGEGISPELILTEIKAAGLEAETLQVQEIVSFGPSSTTK